MMTQDELEGTEVVLPDGRVGRVVYCQHPAMVRGSYVAVKTHFGVIAVRSDEIDGSEVEDGWS